MRWVRRWSWVGTRYLGASDDGRLLGEVVKGEDGLWFWLSRANNGIVDYLDIPLEYRSARWLSAKLAKRDLEKMVEKVVNATP